MSFWLVKSEPTTYSWSDLVKEGRTSWTGVRNFQARNNLTAMRSGDLVLFYHSVGDKEVVGTARVVREAYPDSTSDDERWRTVDLEAVEPLARGVTLEEIKSQPSLRQMALVRQGRLSVMPVSAEEFRTVVSLGASERRGESSEIPRREKKAARKPPKARQRKKKTATPAGKTMAAKKSAKARSRAKKSAKPRRR